MTTTKENREPRVMVSRREVLIFEHQVAERASFTERELEQAVQAQLTALDCPQDLPVRESAYIARLSEYLRKEILIERYYTELRK